jgi:hypothetical protein
MNVQVAQALEAAGVVRNAWFDEVIEHKVGGDLALAARCELTMQNHATNVAFQEYVAACRVALRAAGLTRPAPARVRVEDRPTEFDVEPAQVCPECWQVRAANGTCAC